MVLNNTISILKFSFKEYTTDGLYKEEKQPFHRFVCKEKVKT